MYLLLVTHSSYLSFLFQSKEMIDLLEKHLAESSKQDSESNQSDVQDDSIEAA